MDVEDQRAGYVVFFTEALLDSTKMRKKHNSKHAACVILSFSVLLIQSIHLPVSNITARRGAPYSKKYNVT